MYLDTPYTLHYPSIDNITSSLSKLGLAAQLFKIDISRVFRQIKIDPGDIDLLGMKFEDQYFIYLLVAFGYRHGLRIFQRCTDTIRYIMTKNGFPHLFNYIDDLVYTGLPSNIQQPFYFLKGLLADLGLEISHRKLAPPDTAVTCLGILIDTVHRTFSIPEKKLLAITNMCNTWATRTYFSKRDLQSLLGSLLYITKCIKPTRSFLNRMLQLLEPIPVHLDACLTGLGGQFGSMASKIWANLWSEKKIQIFCDNIAVVDVLNTGKARDTTLATCARNLWLIAVMFNIDFNF